MSVQDPGEVTLAIDDGLIGQHADLETAAGEGEADAEAGP